MRVRVEVRLKDGVLDPQAKAIHTALHSLGFDSVQAVVLTKVVELDLATTDAAEAQAQAEAMGRDLLANTVIERFRVTVLDGTE